MIARPCAECGDLIATGTYCDEHRRGAKVSPRRRGYDSAWDRLSKRARRLQPFCSVPGCMSTDLTVDHTEEAWKRKAAGKTIRLRDVQVLCRRHNAEKGAAR